MIALIGNRPVLQVGRHQISSYDSEWIRDALRLAAKNADRMDFPFVEEICQGIFHYLENKCSLRLLPIADLYKKMRIMLERIGCQIIADSLTQLAPPIQISLLTFASEAQELYEIALFNLLKKEIDHLRTAGANEIHFLHTKECTMKICKSEKWNRHCSRFNNELKQFFHSYDPQIHISESGTMIFHMREVKLLNVG
jgi:hypothetical protein